MAGKKDVPEGMEAESQSVQLTQNDFMMLMKSIADIAGALKKQSDGAHLSEDLSTMVAGLSKIAENSDRGPIKQIPVGRAKIRTKWNPSGAKRRVKFAGPMFLNGHRLSEKMHSDEEITLLNALKPGRYTSFGAKRPIVVQVKDGSEGVPEKLVWIPNKTPADRLALSRFSANDDEKRAGLLTICDKLLAESSKIVIAS